MNDGSVSAGDLRRGGAALQKQLPAGDVYVRPQPESVNGTIVFGNTKFNGTTVTGLTIRFSAGRITSMRPLRDCKPFARHMQLEPQVATDWHGRTSASTALCTYPPARGAQVRQWQRATLL
jgi:leucyl aminopeptidase (aminopeptidase T)